VAVWWLVVLARRVVAARTADLASTSMVAAGEGVRP
jgi:hypothetical protein